MPVRSLGSLVAGRLIQVTTAVLVYEEPAATPEPYRTPYVRDTLAPWASEVQEAVRVGAPEASLLAQLAQVSEPGS